MLCTFDRHTDEQMEQVLVMIERFGRRGRGNQFGSELRLCRSQWRKPHGEINDVFEPHEAFLRNNRKTGLVEP